MVTYSERRGNEQAAATLGPTGFDRHDGSAPRVRRSREELRELVLAAGTELLMAEGLGTGVEHLSFKRVFAHMADTRGIRVTNASVIGRIWQNQEDFQADVVRSVVDAQGDAEVEQSGAALDEAIGRIDLSTVEMRRASLAELIRVTCAQFLVSSSTSAGAIQTALVAYITVAHRMGTDNRVMAAYEATDERLTLRYRGLYEAALEVVGFRIRPGLTMDDALAILTSMAEGFVLRRLADSEQLAPILLVRALDGEEVRWSHLAIGMNAVADYFVEPDPTWQA
jgi:hypothetical protein